MTAIYQPGMTLDDIPIPENASVTGLWPEQMIEMADHIGAYHTLRVIAEFGGQQVDIAKSPERNVLRAVLDARLTRIMSAVYGGNELELPVGRPALNEARRASLIASVRNADMTVREAARIAGTARTYMSRLVNHTQEGIGSPPLRRISRHDPRQIDLFRPTDQIKPV